MTSTDNSTATERPDQPRPDDASPTVAQVVAALGALVPDQREATLASAYQQVALSALDTLRFMRGEVASCQQALANPENSGWAPAGARIRRDTFAMIIAMLTGRGNEPGAIDEVIASCTTAAWLVAAGPT